MTNDKAIEDIFMELDAIFCVEMESGKKVDHDVILRKQAKAALEAATPYILAGQWQDIESAPKDGTRFIGCWYWPTPQTYKRMAESVIKEPASGVFYHYAAITYWSDGKWFINRHEEPHDQDGLFAYKLIGELPNPPQTPSEETN